MNRSTIGYSSDEREFTTLLGDLFSDNCNHSHSVCVEAAHMVLAALPDSLLDPILAHLREQWADLQAAVD